MTGRASLPLLELLLALLLLELTLDDEDFAELLEDFTELLDFAELELEESWWYDEK